MTEQANPLPRGQSRYALAMLAVVYAICIVDRKILTILQEPIKAEFHLADWQLGLLTGFSFALLYSILGIPIARIADRGTRRVTIISIALAVWSIMTAVCGLTQNFVQLLIARVGVGVGEAGCSPPSLSLLADYFPRSGRGRAMGVYALASPIGTAVGLTVGGWLAFHLGWRHALMIVGLPGALLALVFWFTVREPARSVSATAVPPQSVWKTIATLLRIPTFAWLLLACSLASFASYAVQFWFPSFFVRSYKLSLSEVGLWWGLCSGVAGLVGSLGGGWLADKLGARTPRAILAVPAFALLFAIPLQIAATQLGVFGPSLACAALLAVLNQLWIAPNMMLTQSLVEPSMRATSAAVSTFAANIIGLGSAPIVLGMISDAFSKNSGNTATGLGSALAVVTVVYVLASAAFLMASRTIHRDLRD